MANTNHQKVDFPVASLVFFLKGVNLFHLYHVIMLDEMLKILKVFLFECLGLQ